MNIKKWRVSAAFNRREIVAICLIYETQIKEQLQTLVFEATAAHTPASCCHNQCAVDLTFKTNLLLSGSRGDKKEKVECVGRWPRRDAAWIRADWPVQLPDPPEIHPALSKSNCYRHQINGSTVATPDQ